MGCVLVANTGIWSAWTLGRWMVVDLRTRRVVQSWNHPLAMGRDFYVLGEDEVLRVSEKEHEQCRFWATRQRGAACSIENLSDDMEHVDRGAVDGRRVPVDELVETVRSEGARYAYRSAR